MSNTDIFIKDAVGVGYKYSIYCVILPPEFNQIKSFTQKEMIEIENSYCQKFESVFKNRINHIGMTNYKTEISEIMNYIFIEEIKGMRTLKGIINCKYYNELNVAIAFALHNRLYRKTWRYGGYSVSQITHDIEKYVKDIRESQKVSKSDYSLKHLAYRITKHIQQVFEESRENMRKSLIEEIVA